MYILAVSYTHCFFSRPFACLPTSPLPIFFFNSLPVFLYPLACLFTAPFLCFCTPLPVFLCFLACLYTPLLAVFFTLLPATLLPLPYFTPFLSYSLLSVVLAPTCLSFFALMLVFFAPRCLYFYSPLVLVFFSTNLPVFSLPDAYLACLFTAPFLCFSYSLTFLLCPFVVYYLRYAVRSFFTLSRISLADGKRAGQKVHRKIAVAVQKVKTLLLFVPLF
jgi:hypothetical protein